MSVRFAAAPTLDHSGTAVAEPAGHAARPLSAPPAAPRCGPLERLPKWLICVPLVAQWVWLGLQHRCLTLPAAANPTLTAGGLMGEGKLEYFRGMGPVARAATALTAALPNTGRLGARELERAVASAGLAFPLIAKPDLGLCGYGVRRVDDIAALRAYVAAFPIGEVVVLQQWLPAEGEAGIFYARHPAHGAGRIIGLALRHFPRVTGDGRSTLGALIAANARTARLLGSPFHTSELDATRVPAAGEVVRVATIGSTRVGGLYRDGAALITPQLVAAVDAIARDLPRFHCGRFDVRFADPDALRAGRGFTIMEINGAGSEAIQAWDPDISLWRGFSMIFAKQRLLFAIGAANRRAGARPLRLRALARLFRRQQRLIPRYPPSN